MTTPGTCTYCGCTEAEACAGGCAWSDAHRTTCTRCAESEQLAQKALTIFAAVVVRTNVSPSTPWADIPFTDRQLFVMAHRGLIEAFEQVLRDESVGAIADMATVCVSLEEFLEQHFPGELREDEPISATVIRLLTPHVGARIVVP